MSHELPPSLKAALARASEGVSRADLAQRSAAISARYRSGGGSDAIRDRSDALAYAMVRMPATFAATLAALEAASDGLPSLAPQSLIDAGAGTGAASWAALLQFPSVASVTQIDASASLRALAAELAAGEPRLASASRIASDVRSALASAEGSDLVIASYLLAESDEAAAADLAEALWTRTRMLLVLVEPGTPAGTSRILAARARLIAAGAFLVAPCPHALACPLQPPDWCHFAQRLPRSRDHKQVKGAETPFEDEKFIYLAASRQPPTGAAEQHARVVAPPHTGKVAVTARLCLADGSVATTNVPRRARDTFANARRWRWGDAVNWPVPTPTDGTE